MRTSGSRLLARLARQGLPLAPPPCCSAAAAAAAARSYARATGPPGGTTAPASTVGSFGGGAMRAVYNSPNVVAEAYSGTPPTLPLLSLFTREGLRTRWERVLNRGRNMYTIFRVKKDVPGWTMAVFKADACALYRDTCSQIAAGDRNALRHSTTDALLTELKRELRAREARGWARVAWSLDSIEECSVVHGRLVQPQGGQGQVAFAQLTVALRSQQRFAAYDARGRRVAGNEAAPISVEDYWVLERVLSGGVAGVPANMQRWRVAARLQPGGGAGAGAGGAGGGGTG